MKVGEVYTVIRVIIGQNWEDGTAFAEVGEQVVVAEITSDGRWVRVKNVYGESLIRAISRLERNLELSI